MRLRKINEMKLRRAVRRTSDRIAAGSRHVVVRAVTAIALLTFIVTIVAIGYD